jgi:hypothetical protein
MNRERAETFLRALAEAELRAACDAAFASRAPWSADSPAPGFPRLARVAQALTAVHALDVAAAQEVLADFAIAVGVRKHSDPGPLLLTRPVMARGRLYARAWPGPAGPGPAVAGPGAGGPDRLVPLGLTASFRHEDISGEVSLLSYAHTSSGARFTVTWRTRSPVGQGMMGRGFGSPVFGRLFTVRDDRGNGYRMDFSFSDWAGEIRLHPDPPDGLRWLELAAPGQEPVRIPLGAADPAAPDPAAPDLAVADRAVADRAVADRAGPQVTPADRSAGEQMLMVFADRLLMVAGEHGPDLRRTAYARAPLAAMTAGLGHVVAALEAAEALPPLSQVPGQLAALCASLSVTGHGLTAPPGPELPERWLSLLSHYQRRKPDMAPAREGHVPLAVAFPEFDGIRLALLGLHNAEGQTILHLLVSGLPEDEETGLAILENLPVSVWVRDSGGRWHVAGPEGGRFCDGEYWLRMKLRPALARSAAWIEVVAAGRSAEVCATLPLSWGYPP